MLFCLFYFVGRMENPFSNGRIYLCHLPSPYKRDADCAWIGVGPGEGVVKQHIPDSHTDFIFMAHILRRTCHLGKCFLAMHSFWLFSGHLKRLGSENPDFARTEAPVYRLVHVLQKRR